MNNLFNLKSFFKFLSKNKSYTFIDVFGLSISLMFVIIIGVYVTQELSTDKFQENGDHIYALANEEWFGTAYRLAYRLQDRYPEIEKVCPMTSIFKKSPVSVGDHRMNADLLLADTTFFSMFSFELVQGDRSRVLDAKNYAVISETFARKAFPGMDPIGQGIRMNDSVNVVVNGIMKDIKNSTIQYADILIRIDNVKYFNWGMDSEEFSNAGSAVIFIQTRPGTNIQEKEEDAAEYFKDIFWLYKRGIYDKVLFVPLKEVYFSTFKTYGMLLNQGDWSFVMILLSVGIVILLFAIINYINLTVAQTGFRAKEMATRRLLGSSRSELFMRLMMESTFLTFVSFVIGLLLAFAVIPFANNLLQTRIDLIGFINPETVILAILLILIIGGVAGLLPATIISNAKPVDVVKGGFRQKTKLIFSKFFITFQNIITITMIAVSITMVWQIHHLINAPLGYNTENIITIDSDGIDGMDQANRLRNELERLPVVKRVAFSRGTPFNGGNNMTQVFDGKNISFQILEGDSAFYHMLGFEILQENNSGNPHAYYLSEEAFRQLEIPEDSPSFRTESNWNIDIAGKVKDVRLQNIIRSKDPLLVGIRRSQDLDDLWNVLVEVQGDPREAFEQVKTVYEDIIQLDFQGTFIDQDIYESFAAQRRTSTIVIIFSCIAILISLLGLLAMSTYFIQQRSREVAVRKVFGSTNQEILKKLILTFLNYVLIAFIIAIPVIWYFMSNWLSDYDYRISLNPIIFIVAGLFCLLISFITVFWQSYRAANTNPVNSIKTE